MKAQIHAVLAKEGVRVPVSDLFGKAGPGVGPTFAAILTVEIGDVARFARPAQLACWAGLTLATASPTAPCTAARRPRSHRRPPRPIDLD